MYDALFVQLARDLVLTLVTSGTRPARAVANIIGVEALHGIGAASAT
jgi:hypothetical protein